MPLRVISRASQLAIAQVQEAMSHFPEVPWTRITCNSFGDVHQELSLMGAIPSDFFTRELDAAILLGEADLAIHSSKDLPYPLPAGLTVAALLEALDPTDSLVNRQHLVLDKLPAGARVGTSSRQRRAQVAALRPDLTIVDIRGTIEQRLALIDRGELDALIVASCALERLGLRHRATQVLPFNTHPLQGHLALVCHINNRQVLRRFSPLDCRQHWGRVSLVGAGPGDPGLLTLRALEALSRAQVIISDDLANREGIVSQCPQLRAQWVEVGKRKGAHLKTQDEINQLIYEQARSGRRVVRLKGGDPFIFGRGGEELHFLRERLLEPDVIPGITAAQGAAAFAALPLTRRGVASSVAYLTAHPIDQLQIPDVDTLVYYMAASVLGELAQRLVQAGRKGSMPVALIERATLPDQAVRLTTLQQILDEKMTLCSPGVVVIGEVVRDCTEFSWFTGRDRVLCTGLECEAYRDLGRITHQPLIALNPLADDTAIGRILSCLSNFDWVVYTSFSSVRFFFSALSSAGQDSRALAGLRIASVGCRTTQELSRYGLRPDLQPRDESAAGLLSTIAGMNLSSQRMLLPRSDAALPELVEGLRAMGHQVEPFVLFANVLPDPVEKLDLADFQKVVFTSPSTVKHFYQVYGEFPPHLEYIVRGQTTEKELRAWNASVRIVRHQP